MVNTDYSAISFIQYNWTKQKEIHLYEGRNFDFYIYDVQEERLIRHLH